MKWLQLQLLDAFHLLKKTLNWLNLNIGSQLRFNQYSFDKSKSYLSVFTSTSKLALSCLHVSWRWETILGPTRLRWSPASLHPMGSSASHLSATQGSHWRLTWTFVSSRFAWLHRRARYGHHYRRRSGLFFICFFNHSLFVKIVEVPPSSTSLLVN